MKNKLIAIALIFVYLLTCMTFITSAEIDEERVYVLAGEKVVQENQAVTPKSKAIRAVNAPKTEAFSFPT